MTKSDTLLLRQAARADSDAFEALWNRHVEAVQNTARSLSPTCDPEDVAQECFTRLLAALQAGDTVDGPVRPYLYVLAKHIITSWQEPVVPAPNSQLPDIWEETTEAFDYNENVVSAFRSLPPEWRSVLWYTEVEGMAPSELAPVMGISANAVAALAYRAREGLRNAWLQTHVTATPQAGECAWATERIATHARASLSPRQTQRMQRHLHLCPTCPQLLAEVQQVASRLRTTLVPLFLAPALAASLLATKSTAATECSAGQGLWASLCAKAATIAPLRIVGAVTATGLVGVGIGAGVLAGTALPGFGGDSAPVAIIEVSRPDYGGPNFSLASKYDSSEEVSDLDDALFGASADSTPPVEEEPEEDTDAEASGEQPDTPPATTTDNTGGATPPTNNTNEQPQRNDNSSNNSQRDESRNKNSDFDRSSNDSSSSAKEVTPTVQQTNGNNPTVSFAGRAPYYAFISILDENNVEVGKVRAGGDSNWGTPIADTFSDTGKDTMTYRFYASKDDFSTAGQPFATLTIDVP
ncbi:sigma-70 family RNA polymerase sigma factor [Jonesia quinghaiensis]|uniref:sigma-70 family RNA polymerase sigma factor n=1 Tax=Jonesia quinghaiensis TaxID=262806 RepID=UPI000406A3F8|nr:RNA polymerase sigma factor [Jonesia quinghaiensis]